MNYIILDMEWNQPFYKERALLKPVYLRGEIVQIGAVKLDESFQFVDSFKLSVRPRFYKKMNRRVQQLTQITDLDLAYGIPFPQAFEGFQHWCGEEFVFLTWGYDDIPMLKDNLLLHRLDANWIPAHYNLQNIFDAQITNEKKQFSLSYALEAVEEKALEAHDAFNDALSTYFVCRHLDMERGLREYSTRVPGAPKKAKIKKKVTNTHKAKKIKNSKDKNRKIPQKNVVTKTRHA